MKTRNCSDNMNAQDFVDIYQTTFRTPLFTGFLTLTGFLFSVKAFLFANLQKEIYQSDDYLERFKRIRKYDSKLLITAPLRTLNSKLFFCILTTFFASLSQFSLGLIPYSWAAAFCVLVGIFGIVAVGIALQAVRNATIDWMNFVEEKAINKLNDASRNSDPN